MTRETFEAGIAYEGERLDKYLNLIFSETDAAQSRSFFQKLIKEGHVLVNDTAQKANYRLKADDMICVEIPDAVQTPILPENIPLDILYEDDDLLVVNKPKGMVVHPSAGHYTGTLVNAIMYHCRDSLSGINGEIRPGIVHRIDMDTTGSLIVCKNDESHVFIAEQIKEHSVNRRYRGIVYGVVKEEEGTVNAPIGRHPIERKKMAINEKTASLPSPITRFWNALSGTHTWSLNWRPGAPIRSACTWLALVIRCLATRCIPAEEVPISCRGRRFMP